MSNGPFSVEEQASDNNSINQHKVIKLQEVIRSSGCEYAKSMQTGRMVSYGPFNFFKASTPKGNQTPVSGVRGRKQPPKEL